MAVWGRTQRKAEGRALRAPFDLTTAEAGPVLVTEPSKFPPEPRRVWLGILSPTTKAC